MVTVVLAWGAAPAPKVTETYEDDAEVALLEACLRGVVPDPDVPIAAYSLRPPQRHGHYASMDQE